MNRKDVREFLKKRSTIWTLGLCMTGAIVLGGITSMDQARRKAELTETESEPGAQAQLDVNDTLGSSLAGCRDFIDGLQHGRECVFCHLESVQV